MRKGRGPGRRRERREKDELNPRGQKAAVSVLEEVQEKGAGKGKPTLIGHLGEARLQPASEICMITLGIK